MQENPSPSVVSGKAPMAIERKQRVLLDRADVTYSPSAQVALQAAGIRFVARKNGRAYPNEMILVDERDYEKAAAALSTVSHTEESPTPGMRYSAWAILAVAVAVVLIMVVRSLLG